VKLVVSGGSRGQPSYEMVERKGVGHPDTICDAIAERASRRYSQYCLRQFGGVAHHWFDKVMLLGGEARLDYGLGEMIRPYRILVAGKAALCIGDEEIPLQEILAAAAAEVLSEVLTGFDPDQHLRVESLVVDHQGAGRRSSRYRPASRANLVTPGDPSLVSNDSNLLTGYAPLSTLERMVLGVERYVNGAAFKAVNPHTGWDVKVLGMRSDDRVRLVVNVPMLAGHVSSLDHYFALKEDLGQKLRDYLAEQADETPELLVNATDRNGRPYLTALGSVADTGDVGLVGRGNRVNGLITPMRPMSIEAPAGKNPIDHTGKLYALLAHRTAAQLAARLGRAVGVLVSTSKEAPLNDPDEVVVTIADLAAGDRAAAEQAVRAGLAGLGAISLELIDEGVVMW
jgi:S-adenosylmethionine synthetase